MFTKVALFALASAALAAATCTTTPAYTPSVPATTAVPTTVPTTSAPYTTAPHTTVTTVTPSPPAATHISQCNTGNAHCCNSVSKASDPSAVGVAGLVGVVVSGVDALVGLGCTPISILGLGQGANCAQQPVCCENNTYNGLINIGCSPISL